MLKFKFGIFYPFVRLCLLMCLCNYAYARPLSDTTVVRSLEYPGAALPVSGTFSVTDDGLVPAGAERIVLPGNFDPGTDNYELQIHLTSASGSLSWGLFSRDLSHGYSLNMQLPASLELIEHKPAGQKSVAKTTLTQARTKNITLTFRRIAGILYVLYNGAPVLTADYPVFFPAVVWLMPGAQSTAVLKSLRMVRFPLFINEVAGAATGGIKPENLGPFVNTALNEMRPVASADGKTLYFEKSTTGTTDFLPYMAQTVAYEAKESREMNELPAGHRLVQFAGNSGTFYSINSAATRQPFLYFHTPQQRVPMYIAGYPQLSTDDEFTLSPDGRLLIFSCKRTQGRGGYDLYCSKALNDSLWSEPVNLGLTINTLRDEKHPFLAPDGHTLYFTSNGWPGYGMHDIYVSRMMDNTCAHWSPALNLGPRFNSPDAETGISTDAEGLYAYTSSPVTLPGARGSADVYRMALPPAAAPYPVKYIGLKIYDAASSKALPAQVSAAQYHSTDHPGRYVANSDGMAGLYLNARDSLRVLVLSKGYVPYSLNIHGGSLPAEINVGMKKAEAGVQWRLNHVDFAGGDYVLMPQEINELKLLAQLLLYRQDLAVEFAGHTDNAGTAAYNTELSAARLKSVMNALQQMGVPAQRMQGKAYGQHKPFAPNDSEEGRALNRRTEALLLPADRHRDGAAEVLRPMSDTLLSPCDLSFADYLNIKRLRAYTLGQEAAYKPLLQQYGKELINCSACMWLSGDTTMVYTCPGLAPVYVPQLVTMPATLSEARFSYDSMAGTVVADTLVVEWGTGKKKTKIGVGDPFATWPRHEWAQYQLAYPLDPRPAQHIKHLNLLEVQAAKVLAMNTINRLMAAADYEKALLVADSLLAAYPADSLLQGLSKHLTRETAYRLRPADFMDDAIARGDTQLLNKLITAGALRFAIEDKMAEWLNAAVYSQKEEPVKLLVQAGAPVNYADDKGKTLLHKTAEWSKPDMLRLLIRLGADTRLRDKEGETVLIKAVKARLHLDDKELLKALPINTKDLYGNTPLHHAILTGDIRYMHDLLERRAQPDQLNSEGFTALSLALQKQFAEAVPLLLEHRASVSIPNDAGDSPLHVAVRTGRQDLVSLMLQAGADPEAKNNDGLKPKQLAKKLGFKQLEF